MFKLQYLSLTRENNWSASTKLDAYFSFSLNHDLQKETGSK